LRSAHPEIVEKHEETLAVLLISAAARTSSRWTPTVRMFTEAKPFDKARRQPPGTKQYADIL